ncbi:MAG: methyl-accepting chemotaxis protein [Rectinemataceae bacterium]
MGASLLTGLAYLQARTALKDSIRTRVRDYVALGVLSLPAESHSRLRTKDDQEGKDYEEVISALRKIKAGTSDIYYLYTVRKAADGSIVYVADATEEEPAAIGEAVSVVTPLLRASAEALDRAAIEKDFYTDEWGTFLTAYAPIHRADGSLDGLLCADITAGAIGQILLGNLQQLLFLMLLSLLLIVPAAVLLSRSVALPIRDCVAFTDLLAGNDYTGKLPEAFLRRADEIGDLSRSYATMVDNTRRLLQAILGKSELLSGIGRDLSADMDETSTAIGRIDAGIEKIQDRSSRQSTSVTASTRVMERITGSIRELDGHIDEQARKISQSSAAIERMLANIGIVATSLGANAESMGELTAASETGREGLSSVSSSIHDVAKESEGLQEISSVIHDIAKQTQLLSMNAAIEAAHAGEAGKGFAVVADEIRKLSESSGEQATIVSASLGRIKEAVDGINLATLAVLRQFEDIDARLLLVSGSEEGIRRTMEELGSESGGILERVGQLNRISSEVKAGSDGMLADSRDVIGEGQALGTMTEEVAGSVAEMVEGVLRVAGAVEKVQDMSRRNQASIDVLLSEVHGFKI